MNTGAEAIEWLYNDQLQVDPEWSIRTSKGFTWWADKNAQTIEIIGAERGPDGDVGYLLSVRTEFLHNLVLDDRATRLINALLMSCASMAGPVYNAGTRVLSLCSLVRVHKSIRSWINPLISVAAVLQIGEARIMAPELARLLAAEEAISGHPQNGVRTDPDEMAEVIASLIAPIGQQPCKWQEEEFQDTVDRYMRQPPSLGGSHGGLGFTVEFPYGDTSSLCQVMGDRPHPRYQNGLFLLQSFPVENLSDAAGARLALSLNAKELAQKPSSYGFGSYCYRNNMIHFTSFLPNAAYRVGLLPNIYFASAQRAREMSIRLMNSDWTAESFNLKHGVVGSILGDLLDR
jgi:hypothetical protein